MTSGTVYTETVVQPGKESMSAEIPGRFSLVEIIAGEDLGCIAKGQGGAYAREGRTAIRGEAPVNASGGLKSKEHPVGVTVVTILGAA